MADEPRQDSKEYVPAIQLTWREFLESYPVNSAHSVAHYWERTNGGIPTEFVRLAPILRLYCAAECQGVRNFAGHWEQIPEFQVADFEKPINAFIQYTCKDCNKGYKTYALRSVALSKPVFAGWALKLGEFPEVHVELPRSLKPRLGDDYLLFLKGLTCEKQGLGVGAFVYYRRVGESQKGQLIAEILKVAEKLGAPQQMRDNLARAAKEKEFSRALEIIKDAIPEALLVDSHHNPLRLLHDALSIGVHVESDENCLKRAHAIRLVLSDFAERLKLALEEQAGLRAAISDLFKFTSEAKKPSN